MARELHVYGVVPGDAAPPKRTGIDGGRIRTVRSGPVAALVSAAAPGPVLARRASLLAHAEVLRDALEQAPSVLPLRFGIVMPHAAAVRRELLAGREEELLERLDALAGRVELRV